MLVLEQYVFVGHSTKNDAVTSLSIVRLAEIKGYEIHQMVHTLLHITIDHNSTHDTYMHAKVL